MRRDALVSPSTPLSRLLSLCLAVIVLSVPAPARAQEKSPDDVEFSIPDKPAGFSGPLTIDAPAPGADTGGTSSNSTIRLPDVSSRENFSAAMQIIILLTVLSLAPAILIMMTSFTRIIIVLSLLRQALGTQSLPPNQILIGLSMFMTFLIMGPTWERVNNEALRPYLDGALDQRSALE